MYVKFLNNNNRIIYGERTNLGKAQINYGGSNNILYIEGNVSLGESKIKFNGDDSIIFLRTCQAVEKIDIEVFNDNVFYIGKDCTINVRMKKIVLSEQKNIFIGNDVMFSFDVMFRNSDPHLIYSIESKERINPSKSVFIGDHVWIGQNVLLLKGTQIASGSIIGANSVLSGKRTSSNEIWAGNPAKKISEGKFWSNESVHSFKKKDTEKYQKMMTDKYIFEYDTKVYISFDDIDRRLTEGNNVEDRLNYLIELSNFNEKNRFSI